MKDSEIKVLDEDDHIFVKTLSDLGTSKKVATTIAYLMNVDEASSREIEISTGLRQPEISVAMRPLKERGWVDERSEKKNKGKGRPVKYYQLTVPFLQIIKTLEEEFLKSNYEKVIALRRLRELKPYCKTEPREIARSVLPDRII